MNRYLSPRARGVAAALAVLVGLTAAAPPASAAATPKPLSTTTVATTAAAKLASMDTAAAVAPAQDVTGGGASESKPFFKTGKGIAALVLMVGASAWLIQSRTSDNVVHSPGRQ